MTGAEIIGTAGVLAGKIVTETAKDIRETEKTVRKELVAVAKETEEFKQAARVRAKRIAIKEVAFLQVFRPIRKLIGLSAEYFEHGFEDDMKPRLEAIPEENRTSPKPTIAAPAMQGLAFSLDEPDLKKLYLDLLASASDDRRSGSVHPAFVEVIRQLAAPEVELLAFPLSTGTPLAMVRIRRKQTSGGGGFTTLAPHVMALTDTTTGLPAENNELAMYVDNWIRLGLVEVDYGTYLTREGAYDWAETRPELLHLRALHTSDTATVHVQKGLLQPTSFGINFGEAVGMTR